MRASRVTPIPVVYPSRPLRGRFCCRYRLILAAWLLCIALPVPAGAEEPAAQPAPAAETPAKAEGDAAAKAADEAAAEAAAKAAAEFQQRALEFARRDAERAAPFAAEAAKAADGPVAAARPAEEAHAQAAAAKAEADKALARIVEAMQVAEQGKQAAAQSIPAAEAALKQAEELLSATNAVLASLSQQLEIAQVRRAAAVELAQNATTAKPVYEQAQAAAEQGVELLESAVAQATAAQSAAENGAAEARKTLEALKQPLADATAQLAALAEEKPKAEAAVAAAQQKLAEAEAALKPLAEAKAAALKRAADAEAQAKQAAARVAVLEKTVPQADPASIRLVKTFSHDRPIMSCAFDSTGQFLFGGAQDDALHRWDFISGSRVDLPGQKSWICRLDIHREGDLLITGSYAGRLSWWNPLEESPQPLRAVDAHKGHVRSVSVSPDKQLIATCGTDAAVRVWSAADGSLVAELPGHARDVWNVRFHPNGQRLYSGDLMGVLKEWEVGTWKHVRDLDASVLHKYDEGFQADCGGIRGMDFSPDGKFLVVCGISEVTNAFAGVGVPTAVLYDCESGAQVKVMKPAENYQGSCWSVAYDPSGKFIVGAGGGGSGMMWFWKPGEEKSFFHFAPPAVVYDVAFHPDGLRLAAALYDNTVAVYDLGPKVEVAAK